MSRAGRDLLLLGGMTAPNRRLTRRKGRVHGSRRPHGALRDRRRHMFRDRRRAARRRRRAACGRRNSAHRPLRHERGLRARDRPFGQGRVFERSAARGRDRAPHRVGAQAEHSDREPRPRPLRRHRLPRRERQRTARQEFLGRAERALRFQQRCAGFLGPPRFEDAAIDVGEGSANTTIALVYHVPGEAGRPSPYGEEGAPTEKPLNPVAAGDR